jgi:hypothetical protein
MAVRNMFWVSRLGLLWTKIVVTIAIPFEFLFVSMHYFLLFQVTNTESVLSNDGFSEETKRFWIVQIKVLDRLIPWSLYFGETMITNFFRKWHDEEQVAIDGPVRKSFGISSTPPPQQPGYSNIYY